jgi:hypothetical protein
MRMQFVSYVRESIFQYIFTKRISNVVCVCVSVNKQLRTLHNFFGILNRRFYSIMFSFQISPRQHG